MKTMSAPAVMGAWLLCVGHAARAEPQGGRHCAGASLESLRGAAGGVAPLPSAPVVPSSGTCHVPTLRVIRYGEVTDLQRFAEQATVLPYGGLDHPCHGQGGLRFLGVPTRLEIYGSPDLRSGVSYRIVTKLNMPVYEIEPRNAPPGAGTQYIVVFNFSFGVDDDLARVPATAAGLVPLVSYLEGKIARREKVEITGTFAGKGGRLSTDVVEQVFTIRIDLLDGRPPRDFK